MKDEERQTEIYLSTGELMYLLGVSRSTVYRMLKKGLPYLNVGPNHRFPKEQVLAWLKEKYG